MIVRPIVCLDLSGSNKNEEEQHKDVEDGHDHVEGGGGLDSQQHH